MKHISVLLLSLFLLSYKLCADVPVVKTYILQDTVQLGEPFKVSLSVKHLLTTDISIQESFNNGIEKTEFLPFPTQKTKDGFVTDSGVYTLRAFGNKQFINFQIPVVVITKNDTISIPQKDSIRITIIKSIHQIPENLQFASAANFYEPHYPFDYISWGIAGAVVLSLAVILLLVFSSQIKVWWKTRTLKKAFTELQLYVEKLPSSLQSKKEVETVIQKWKIAQGKIENKILSAYTTKELNYLYNNDQLTGILKEADACIYGKEKEIPKSEIDYLVWFSEQRLNLIIEQLKGKSK